MPKVKKIAAPEKKKRGRKSAQEKQVMYIFRCPEGGCELQSISSKVEAFCGVHDGVQMLFIGEKK